MLRGKEEVLSVSARRKKVIQLPYVCGENFAMFMGIREQREPISLMWDLVHCTHLYPYEKLYLQM